MSDPLVDYEFVDESVAIITINRPSKLNALNEETLEALESAVWRALDDGNVRGILITGAGEKAFVAGADISQFTSLDSAAARSFALRGQQIFSTIENATKPVVAAVNGFALGGGCELALACHIRIAAENAVFGQPEVKLGVIPGYGGTQRLPRLVGRGVATEMILVGNNVDANRAAEIGLVNKVVPLENLRDEALGMLKRIGRNGPLAVAASLRAINNADGPLSTGLEREADLFGEVFDTEDMVEGVTAFLEKRKPSFKSK